MVIDRLSVQGPIVNVLGSVSQMVSVGPIQFHHCRVTVATDKM